MQGAEAFVEVNDPHVAVRMRKIIKSEQDWLLLMLSDTRLLLGDVSDLPQVRNIPTSKKARLSTSDTHRAAYFELLNLEDSNAVADKLKAKLIDLGYKLTNERFPV